VIIHTTKSAAEYLQRRYAIQVQSQTVKQWCNRGKLPGAQKIGEGLRGVWQIPEPDLDNEAKIILRLKSINKVQIAPKSTPSEGGGGE
jgi:hypothetical protein